MGLTSQAQSSRPGRDEASLVRATRRGDDHAFEQLYAGYRDRIHAFILSRVHDHGRAEDLGQEVFMSALRQLRASEADVTFKPWLYTIAKNACIDEFRRGSRTREVLVDSDAELGSGAGAGERFLSTVPSPDEAVASKQKLADLRGAFGGLNETQHRLIVMREFEGLSYDEIGDRLGMTRQMVESGLFRARRKLGEEYDELASGRRCAQIQTAIDEGRLVTARGLGIKERRRCSRHLAHCQPCRQVAMMSGVDRALLDRRSLASRVAALLPLPLLRRLWSFMRGGGRPGGGGPSGGAGSAGAAGSAGGAGGAGAAGGAGSAGAAGAGAAGAAGAGTGATAGAVTVAGATAAGSGIGLGSGAAMAAFVLACAGGGVAISAHGSHPHHLVAATPSVVHAAPASTGSSTRGPGLASAVASAGSTGRAARAAARRAHSGAAAAGHRAAGGAGSAGGAGGRGGHGVQAGATPSPGTGAAGPSPRRKSGSTPAGGRAPSSGANGTTPAGTGGTSGATKAGEGAGSGVKSTASGVTNGAKTTVSSVTSGVKTTASGVTNGVKTTVSTTLSGVKTTVSSVTSGVKTTVSGVTGGVKTTVSSVTSGVKTTVSSATSGVKTTVSSIASGAPTTVTEVTTITVPTVPTGITSVGSTVSSITSGLPTTLSGITGGLATTVSGTSTGLTTILGGLLGP